MYNVGLIGCGFIGCKAPDNHAQAYIDCFDTDLVFLCDKDMAKVAMAQAKYSLVVVMMDDYMWYLDRVKKHALDIVSVCTPPETHKQIVCDIAPYVKAIYCEKPIALTLEDADEMIESCHKHKVILQINHQRRFMIPKIRFSRGIINNGTHVFDLLRHLFGEVEYEGIDLWQFGKTLIEIEYIDTDEHISGFDCLHSKEPMILKGVENLVSCLKGKKQSISSGEDGKEALRLALEYEKLYSSSNK